MVLGNPIDTFEQGPNLPKKLLKKSKKSKKPKKSKKHKRQKKAIVITIKC